MLRNLLRLEFKIGNYLQLSLSPQGSSLLCLTVILMLWQPSSDLAASQEPKILNIYNWSNYIGQNTISDFTALTGIKVNYDVFDSNDILNTKLMVGATGFDIVFPSAMPFFAKQIRAGVYQKLDLTKIPNARAIDPEILRQLRLADPDNAFGLPYLISQTGIGYVTTRVTSLVPDAPVASLALLFNKTVVNALRTCGVTLPDAADEVFPAALRYLGRNPSSTSEADLDAAAALVAAARPAYRYFHSSRYISDLASGEICVAQGWTGDLVRARQIAREANNGINIAIFLPNEGSCNNLDVMAIPKDAPHPDNAHQFINYILDPKVLASITVATNYPNAVPASRLLIPDEVSGDSVIYPPQSLALCASAIGTVGYERERNRRWTRIKAGY